MTDQQMLERYERERREDEARWQRYRQTGEVIPHERVMAWLDEQSRPRDRNTG